MKVLIVDDDRELVDLLTFSLERANFEVVAAHDEPAGRRLIETEQPDLIVLDTNLGARDGLSLLRDLRRHSREPVIMLTARDREEDKVLGLELGADDYVTKPFSHRELIARIRAQLRRAGHDGPEAADERSVLEVGPLTLDTGSRHVTLSGAPVSLTVTEFRLLRYLMERAGTVVSTAALLRGIWGYDFPAANDVVRVTVHRLRRKLDDDAAEPKLVHTVPGVGFMLRPEAP